MQDEHKYLQLLGSVFLIIFSGLLLAVRYIGGLTVGWKDALVLAALYNLVAVTVRMATFVGILSQLEARVLNGLIAGVFVSTLLISIITNMQTARREAQHKTIADVTVESQSY